jgi:Flp pilus assembly protein TadD
LSSSFWSEGDRLLEESIEAECRSGSAEAAITAQEKAAALNPKDPKFQQILASTYALVSNERMAFRRIHRDNADEILSCMAEAMRRGGTPADTWVGSKLDKAVGEALEI